MHQSKLTEVNGEDELRIILLGKTGVGKSSVGNLILGEKKFTPSCSPRSQTLTCEKYEKNIGGKKIVVIDTPGICDTSTEEQSLEIKSFMVECAPGPHVIIIVIEVGRQSRENQLALDKLLKCFTGDVVNHLVLLFTHGYDLEDIMTIHDFIHNKVGTQTLKDLAKRCGNRVHIIDNTYWNSRASDILTSLQGLNLSEQALSEIIEKMENTSAEETPWLNELSDQSGNVEAEKSEEQSRREYRTNRYQLTQLMKSIKTILALTKGQPYRNEALEAVGEANNEVENILKEMGVERETVDMVEIRRRARERVRNKLQRQFSGVVVGILLGALLGVGVGVSAPVVIVAGLIRALLRKANHQRPHAGYPPAQTAGLSAVDVAEGVVGGAGNAAEISATTGTEVANHTGDATRIQLEEATRASVVALFAGAATRIGIEVGVGVLLLYGAWQGGASGYKESKTSDNPKQAADKAAKAVVQTAGDVLKACWILGNTNWRRG